MTESDFSKELVRQCDAMNDYLDWQYSNFRDILRDKGITLTEEERVVLDDLFNALQGTIDKTRMAESEKVSE